jgi:tRNA-splicing ligase RtcB
MKWVKYDDSVRVAIKSWCEPVDESAMEQAVNLANHPVVDRHVALMPDCHTGYGMPIGGVIACLNAVIPNAVGVDIGCGMAAVETDYPVESLKGDKAKVRAILDDIKQRVPVGEGKAHKTPRSWDRMDGFFAELEGMGSPGWLTDDVRKLAYCNLGTLGGGNHFIEIQESQTGKLWMMLHSGSRNLGHQVASFYHKLAQGLNEKWHSALPSADLAFLPADSEEGGKYTRDMGFAMEYAAENRARMMACFKEVVSAHLEGFEFLREINIHHNYAALENHFGKNRWIHRKGATSAKEGQLGIIPGSMGTPSYIVAGLGNHESFQSCSHGAGRTMGRMQASRSLTLEACDQAMGDVVYDRWKTVKKRGKKKENGERLLDFGEAPLAYKDIDAVIEAQTDLVQPLVKLHPIGVLKG